MDDELKKLIDEQAKDMAAEDNSRIVELPRVKRIKLVTLEDIHRAPLAYLVKWQQYMGATYE
jgi:hypothetical protein